MKKKILFGILIVFVAIGLMGILSDSGTKEEITQQETNISEVVKEKSNISAERLAALGKATLYASEMFMSKKGVYEQLISEVEGFNKEDAEYAVNNIEIDWNKNALEKAKMYQKEMHMSKKAIYDQLTSSYGEKFTKEEANYAIENLEK